MLFTGEKNKQKEATTITTRTTARDPSGTPEGILMVAVNYLFDTHDNIQTSHLLEDHHACYNVRLR